MVDGQVGWSLGSAEALGEVDMDVEGEEKLGVVEPDFGLKKFNLM